MSVNEHMAKVTLGLLLLLLGFESLAQVRISSSTPTVKSCFESDTVRVSLVNTSSSALDSIQYNAQFPNDVEYVLSSIRNGVERSISNLNTPGFSHTSSLSSGDSVILKYVLKGGCDLDDKNRFPVIQHSTTTYASGTTNSNTLTDTLATFVLPDLAIASTRVLGSAYTFFGDTIDIEITLTNNSFADLESIAPYITFSNLSYVSSTLDSSYYSGGRTYLVYDSTLKSKTSLKFNIKMRVESCNSMVVYLHVPWGCKDDLCNSRTATINVSGAKTIQKPNISIVAGNVQHAQVNHPICANDTLWLWFKNNTPEPNIKGSGSFYNLRSYLSNYKTEPYLANGIFDSVRVVIGDTAYRARNVGDYEFGFRDSFTRNVDGPGGLEDLDGDGFYDDLRSGDSVRLGITFLEPLQCLGLKGTDVINDWFRTHVHLSGTNGCNQYVHNIANTFYHFVHASRGRSTSLSGTSADTSTPVHVTYYPGFLSMTNCLQNGKGRSYIIKPSDLNFDNISVSATKGNESYRISGDTLIVEVEATNIDTSNRVQSTDLQISFDLVVTCNTTSRFGQLEYINTIQCDTTCNSCETVVNRGWSNTMYFQPCGTVDLCGGAVLDGFSVQRMNLGWDNDLTNLRRIDSTEAYRDRFVSNDTVRLLAQGGFEGVKYDSLYFSYYLDMGELSKFRVFDQLRASFVLFDSSGNYKGQCNQFTHYDSANGNGRLYYWNLSDNNCSSLSFAKGDSIVFEALFNVVDTLHDNQRRNPYRFDQNYAFFSTDSGGNVNSCNYRGGSPFLYYQINPFFELATGTSCRATDPYSTSKSLFGCGDNAMRFSLGLYSVQGIPFGNEYRPYGRLDKLQYVFSDLIRPKRSYAIIQNNIINLNDSFTVNYLDTIPLTISGDTATFDLSKGKSLPVGFGYCGRSSWALVVPVDFTCHNNSGNYRSAKFITDFTVNLHADSSKWLRYQDSVLQKNVYYQLAYPNVQATVNSVDAKTDTAYWEISIQNTSTYLAPYQTIFFTDDDATTTVFKVEWDGKEYFPTRVDSATQRVDLDTLHSKVQTKARVYFTFTDCNYDQVAYRYGFGCDSIKLDSQDNMCRVSSGFLSVNPQPISPRIAIISEPTQDSVDLCDPLEYLVELTNTQTADGTNLNFAFLPPDGDGFSILVDSSYYYYKVDTTTTFSLGAPVYDTANYQYNWTLPQSVKLKNVNELKDLRFRLVLAPNCNFRQNDFVRFQASAIAPCQQRISSNIVTGGNIVLNNINDQVVSHYSRSTIRALNESVCDTMEILYTWVNLGNDSAGSAGHPDPDTTTSLDFMEISFPAGISQTAFDVIPKTLNANALTITDSFSTAQNIYLKLNLPSGLDKRDSLAFALKFVPSKPDTCAITFHTSIRNHFVFTSFCTTQNDTCELIKETGYRVDSTIRIDEEWSYDISDLNVTLLNDTTTERASVRFTLNALSGLSELHPIYYSIYHDVDVDGKRSASDTVLFTSSKSVDLDSGSALSVLDTLSLSAGVSCNLILVIDDNSCLCVGSDTVFPNPILPNLSYTDTICYDTVNGVRLGSPIYNAYSTIWSGDTSLFQFNDTLAQPMVRFTGTNPVSLTSYTFIREISLGSSGCKLLDTVDLAMNRIPEVDLGDDIHACVFDSSTIFIDRYDYTIQWGNGATDSFYRTYDDEVITVTVTNRCGSASDTLNYFMEALDILSLPFATDSIQCLDRNFFIVGANISNQSTDTIRYNWDWKNGVFQNRNPAYLTYTSTIDTNISVVATNGWCTDSMETHLAVLASPTSDFDIVKIDSCERSDSFHLVHTDAYVNAFTYTWNLGDGNTITGDDSIAISYGDTGSFEVKLVVALPGGCADSTMRNITVYPDPIAGFTVSLDSQCLRGNDFRFTNTSLIKSGSMQFRWDFGDNTTSSDTNANKTYTQHGDFVVKLIASTPYGCSDSITDTIRVHEQPTADFNMILSDSCERYNQVQFTNASTINSDSLYLFWQLGDGTTSSDTVIIRSYDSAGTYLVQLATQTVYGCSDTLSDTIEIHSSPTALFGIDDDEQCLRENLFYFTDSSSINNGTLSYLWDFGDDSTAVVRDTNHRYINHGDYSAQLIVTSDMFCSDTAEKQIRVHQQPNAQFRITTVDSCLRTNEFTYTNTSTIASDSLYLSWDLGNSTTSSDSTVSALSYSFDSTYHVRLIAQTVYGCADTATDSVIVYPQPMADFTIIDSLQCLSGNQFVFTNQSTIKWGSLSYLWATGDGGSDTARNTSHRYTKDSTYTVSLVTTSTYGCSDSATALVTVYEQPAAQFSIVAHDSCLSTNRFDFVNHSQSKNDSLSYLWFVDGVVLNADTSQSNYTFTTPGNHFVQLIATSENGCVDSLIDSVYVYPNPVSGFTIDDSAQCLRGNSFQFTTTSSISEGRLTRRWEYGDGNSDTTEQSTHVYTNSGVFPVKLVNTSEFGCRDSVVDSVEVHQQPIAGFTTVTNDSCSISSSFDYHTTASIISDSLLYVWEFDNTVVSQDSSILNQHISAAGSYIMKQRVSTVHGCVDSIEQTVRVYQNPTSRVTSADTVVCFRNHAINLTNTSTGSGTLRNTYDFGNGLSDTVSEPTIQYADTGTYVITHVVSTSVGCLDTGQLTISVLYSPTASFTIDSVEVCEPQNLFNFYSTSTGRTNSRSFWDLGNGFTTESDSVINYSYGNTGGYDIRLIAEYQNALQCSDTATAQVRVLPHPTAGFDINDTAQCLNNNSFTFTNTGTAGASYLYSFGDGGTGLTENATRTYADTGAYVIKQVIGLHNRCFDSITHTVRVIVVPSARVTVPDDEQCLEGNSFDMYLNGPLYNGTISWVPETAVVLTDSSVNHSYSDPGVYPVKVSVYTGQCSDSSTFDLTVHPTPVVEFRGDSVCSGEVVQFNNTSTIASGVISTYAWQFGDGNSSDQVTPSHLYQDTGRYEVKLEAISDQNCSALDSAFSVRIYPEPVAIGSMTFGNLTGSGQPVVYNSVSLNTDQQTWMFDDGEVTSENPYEKTYVFTGSYSTWLIAENIHGCIDSLLLDTSLTVPRNMYIPSAFSPNDDGINDFFGVNLRAEPIEFKLSVFNRWGEMLFVTDDASEQWDGTYKGETVQNGVYFYIINIKNIGDLINQSGTIEVMR